MKSILLSILLLVFFTNLFSQTEFELIKTDNSKYPEIKVYLKTNNLKTLKEDFTISSDTTNINFEFEKTIYKDIKMPKSILFVIDHSIKDSLITKKIIKSWLSEMEIIDKVNFVILKHDKNKYQKATYYSAEFSSDFAFFANKMTGHFINIQENSKLENFQNKTTEIINFIFGKENMTQNKAIIFITKDLVIGNMKSNFIKSLKSKKTPIYFAINGKVDSLTEKNIIKICNLTGGIYRETKLNSVKKIVNNYIEDISLQNSQENSTLYILSFKNFDSENKLLHIKYKNKTKNIFLKTPKVISYNKYQSTIIIISTLAILLLALVSIIYIFKNKKLRKKIKTISEIKTAENKEKNISLNAKLILQTKGFSKEFKITKDETFLGRSEENDFEIPDSTVSSVHAELTSEKSGYFLKDLGSTNGTFVNGERIEFTKLHKNDKIKLGSAFLVFKIS